MHWRCVGRHAIHPLAWAIVAVLFMSATGYAQTPRIYGQGTAASGQGNAFAAQADDASAIHYNPAGMTQLRGVQLLTGSLFVGGVTTHVSPTGQTKIGRASCRERGEIAEDDV